MAVTRELCSELVVAALNGDQRAQDELVAVCLPLVYKIVGRALNGHHDVDDVVQETMLRVLRSLGSLKAPSRYQSWLVAITMNQIRQHWRDRDRRDATVRSAQDEVGQLADPGADVAGVTVLRLGLEDQRREAAEAARWLSAEDQGLLMLWGMEARGELTRAEVVAALKLSPQHTAVRVQRMKAQLETARLVVRTLSAQPRCVLLAHLTAPWDNTPSALWRKRVARHARQCAYCAGLQRGLVPAERLLVGLGSKPAVTGVATGHGGEKAARSAGVTGPAPGRGPERPRENAATAGPGRSGGDAGRWRGRSDSRNTGASPHEPPSTETGGPVRRGCGAGVAGHPRCGVPETSPGTRRRTRPGAGGDGRAACGGIPRPGASPARPAHRGRARGGRGSARGGAAVLRRAATAARTELPDCVPGGHRRIGVLAVGGGDSRRRRSRRTTAACGLPLMALRTADDTADRGRR
ncbi:RNA polymerase sigma factor [Streptomyces sp. NPDC091377]|uniref:RNA polymerase sigma factor n=1 Tax=Streptomyces sp. NPDC091377 TaxID=3365995 RepID=UPI00381F87A4